LTELKRRGYKLGVITNTVTSREEHVRLALRKIDVEKYFDVIVTSVDVGFNKPDERIFLTALKALNVRPEESVMVGLAQKRLKQLKGLDKDTVRRRLSGYLQRRGFVFELITKVLKELVK